MAGPSLYPILLNRGTTQPPDLYPLFMERDDLVPLRAREGLLFVADGFPPCPITPVRDTDIIQDHAVLVFDESSEAAPACDIRQEVDTSQVQDRSALTFDTASEPQPDQNVKAVRVAERDSERAIFKVKLSRRKYDA